MPVTIRNARSGLRFAGQLRLWRADLPFGMPEETLQPHVDCYPHPGGGLRAGVLVCPGGAYGCHAEHEGVDVAERFNQLGFHAFVLKYRVAPYFRYPAPMLDAFRAIRVLRSRAAELLLDPRQLAVCGFSAGGHLAAATGVLFNDLDARDGDAADAECQRPDALILGYPVISFDPLRGHRGSGDNLLGADRGEAMAEDFRLDRRVSPETPPTFLWHTAADGAVPVGGTLDFAEALKQSGVPFGLHVFPEGPHGLGLAPDWPDVRVWPELCRDFLKHRCRFTCGA